MAQVRWEAELGVLESYRVGVCVGYIHHELSALFVLYSSVLYLIYNQAWFFNLEV